jgi:hypothetical protein
MLGGSGVTSFAIGHVIGTVESAILARRRRWKGAAGSYHVKSKVHTEVLVSSCTMHDVILRVRF